MSIKFKAAILFEQKKPLIIDEVEFSEKLKIGQVLVEVLLSGICGSQIGEIEGVKGPDKYLPHLLGHEACAKVVDIGPGVKHLKNGDLVVLHWRKGNGLQSETPTYSYLGRKVNAGWLTTFNKFAVVSENRCTVIPSDTDYKIAALFGCAITTGFGVIENDAKIKMGESVVIFGAGGIGLNIIQGANLKSAWPIIAVDLYENRLELASKVGADFTINASKSKDLKRDILDILGEKDLDIFIDNTGLPKIIELGYELVNSNGKVVLVGVPKSGEKINIFSLPLHFGKTIVGSHGGGSKPDVDILRYLNLVKYRDLDFNQLISEIYELDEINEAINSIKNGKSSGRILIKP